MPVAVLLPIVVLSVKVYPDCASKIPVVRTGAPEVETPTSRRPAGLLLPMPTLPLKKAIPVGADAEPTARLETFARVLPLRFTFVVAPVYGTYVARTPEEEA